ncbi:DinB family protein [Paenibacillus sp. GCM10027628]|uniref:DinB family protein n=1 Tax=Paenibacillus sp. GCM10027628 TaxID=3273413 RepID=UPI0036378760
MKSLQEARHALWKGIEDLSDDQLHTKIGDRWSVLENLEHIYLMEQTVGGLLRKAFQASAGEPAAEQNLESMIDRTNKYNAPPFGHPKGLFQNLDQAKQFLAESLSEMNDIFTSVEHSKLATYSLPHPVVGVLGLHQWEAFMALHSLRHLAQIEDLKPALR